MNEKRKRKKTTSSFLNILTPKTNVYNPKYLPMSYCKFIFEYTEIFLV